MVKLLSSRNSRVLSVLIALLLLMTAHTVRAADIRVEGNCNLYDAIRAANSNSAVSGCASGYGNDSIILTSDIVDFGRLPTITSNIAIEGNHHDLSFRSSEPAFRIQNGQLIIKNLDVDYVTERDESAIYVIDGELTVVNSSIENCTGSIFLQRSSARVYSDSDICDLPSYFLFSGSNYSGVVVPVASGSRSNCDSLPGDTASVVATAGLASGVQCQQVNAAGVGIQSVIDAGFIDAVDVWRYVEQGLDICFPQLGSIIFLDAATAPRTVTSIDSYRDGDKTCVRLDRPGTVVLMPGQPTTVRTTAVPSVVPPVTVSEPIVDGCPITTTGHLKLRAEPSLDGEILGYVPRGSPLGVISRTRYWFQVNYQGTTGWIGGAYVANTGNC